MVDHKIRIYVACLAAYNAGKHHGEWIDLDKWTDEDDIFTEIKEIISTSPEPFAEEHAIHAFEFPFGIEIDEGETVADLVGIVDGLYEHGESFARVYNYYGGDIDTVLEEVERVRHFADKYDLFADYIGENIYEELPSVVKNCLDWDHVIRNIELTSIFLERDSTHDGFFQLPE